MALDKFREWIARERHRLSHAHVQMARELGMNPKKLGKLDNHKQEPWKAPLPVFIEECYFKRFKKERPDQVRSIERRTQMIASRLKAAKFRKVQTIDGFNFKHSAVTEKIEKPYLSLYHSISKEHLPSAIFTGNAGLGKTHLVRSLGYAACAACGLLPKISRNLRL